MPIPTKRQYERVLRADVLPPRERRFLHLLFSCPGHRATSVQLGTLLGYRSHGGANFDIGDLGEAISRFLNHNPPYRRGTKHPNWFSIVADAIATDAGCLWVMHNPLVQAMKSVGFSAEGTGIFLSTGEQLGNGPAFREGTRYRVAVDIFERSKVARGLCIAHYGARCAVCDFDFQSIYGEMGRGFIHVHHIKRLADRRKAYDVDPVRDLRPVCPNCHAMVHITEPPISIDELRRKLARRTK